MTRRESIIVTGVAEVDAILKQAPLTLQKQLLRRASRTIAQKVRKDAVSLVPQDTGLLARSLKVRAVAKGRGVTVRQQRGTVGASVRTIEGLFRGDTFYGGFLEYGTKARYTKSGAFRGIIRRAFAFLRPALYRNENYAKREFAGAVKEAQRDLERLAMRRLSKQAAQSGEP